MKYNTGLVPSPPDSRDYIYKAIVQPVTQKVPEECTTWMQYISPVKYQGDLGACVCFASTAAVEIFNSKEYGAPFDLSEQFLYDEAKKIDGVEEEGTYFRAAFSVLRHKGVCEEVYQPYEAIYPPINKLENGGLKNAEKYKIVSYASVEADVESLKRAIYQTGPVLVGIHVWDSFVKTPESGIVAMPTGKRQGAHALALVGYTKDYFIAKNSWSPYWGKEGYCYISWDVWNAITLDEAWSIVDSIQGKRCFLIRLFNKLIGRGGR